MIYFVILYGIFSQAVDSASRWYCFPRRCTLVQRIATFIQRYFTYILFRTLFLLCFHLHFPLKHHILKNIIRCNVYKLDYKYNTVHVIQYWNINTLNKIYVIYYVYRNRLIHMKPKENLNQIKFIRKIKLGVGVSSQH